MGKALPLSFLDVVLALSDAMDLVSPLVVGHHKKVACLAHALGREIELDGKELSDLVVASALHDCGAFSLKDRIDSLEFEILHPHEHAEQGFQILRMFPPLEEAARTVRFHHVPWDHGAGRRRNDEEVPLSSHVIHLADRVAVLIDESAPILEQRESICDMINRHRGTLFHPDIVDSFNALAELEYFWFDTVSPNITGILSGESTAGALQLTPEEFKGLIRLFYRVIDFRSSFTATHTSGVHACAEALARLSSLSPEECERIAMAACLHDLGKLSVPKEILEKRGPLTHHELTIMRGHPYYGYRILERFPSMRDINVFASFHHERLDGTGYPFHLQADAIPLGSRIMALADIFTAITEDRPYRQAMDTSEALVIMESMARYGKIDRSLLETLKSEIDLLNDLRTSAQLAASESYESFCRHCLPGDVLAGER